MGKNLYLREVYFRQNWMKEFILDNLYFLASPFRLILEVLIREGFGSRYFSFGQGVTMLLVLSPMPFVATHFLNFWETEFQWGYLLTHFMTWYLFSFYVLWTLLKRKKEIKLDRKINGFEKFSRAAGSLTEEFVNLLSLVPRKFTPRQTEILAEPGFFFIAGVVLTIIGQYVGIALIISALMYSVSYYLAYRRTDNFIQDLLDELYTNQMFEEEFLNGKNESEDSGIVLLGDWPTDPGIRKSLSRMIVNDDEEIELAVR